MCLVGTFYFGTPFAIINQLPFIRLWSDNGSGFAKGGAFFMEKTIRTNKLINLIQGSLIVIYSLLSTGTLLQTLHAHAFT